MCDSDAACSIGERCNQSPLTNGSVVHLECPVPSMFTKFLGGIGGRVTFNCQGMNSSESTSNGQCSATVYRVEQDYTLQDPFFSCSMFNCTRQAAVEKQVQQQNGLDVHLVGIQRTGLVLIVLALGGIIGNSWTRRRSTKGKIFFGLFVALLLVTVLLILVLGAAMHYRSTLSEKELIQSVRYSCLYTNCTCSDDPPAQYRPQCKHSPFGTAYISNLRGQTTMDCQLNSTKCILTLGNFAIPSECRAATCEPYLVQNVTETNLPDLQGSPTRIYSTDILVVGIALLLLLALGLHRLQSNRNRKRNELEFLRRFGNVNAPSCSIEKEPQPQPQSVDLPAKEILTTIPTAAGVSAESMDDTHSTSSNEREEGPLVKVNEMSSGGSSVKLTSRLVIQNLSYEIQDGEGRKKTILDSVEFSVQSGEMLALMGPSGAGKTTLLDLLAQRLNYRNVQGTILFDGVPVLSRLDALAPKLKVNRADHSQFRRLIGYVAQEDTLLPTLTVRQTIHFAARFKLPTPFSEATIDQLVRETVRVLRLTHCIDSLIGDANNRGLSGGEKRRVSIGVELVSRPKILFLDEPTSGLDSCSALYVMEAIAGIIKAPPPTTALGSSYFDYKPMVVFSIHQPSHEIFQLFDKVLLMAKGSVMYCGPAASAVTQLIRRSGFTGTPTTSNAADFLLQLEDKLSLAERQRLVVASRDAELGERTPGGLAEDTPESDRVLVAWTSPRYHLDFWGQFGVLCKRNWLSLFGSYYLIVAHAIVTLIVGLLMSWLYESQPLDLSGALNRAGSLTFLLIILAFVSLSAIDLFLVERQLFLLERDNQYYRTFPYYLSKLVFDLLPLRLLPTLVLGCIIYVSMGFRTDDATYFFWFLLVIALFSVTITCTVLCVAIVAPSFGSAALISSVIILWHFVFGGLMVQADTMPAYFRPFRLLSPFYLAFESLLVNELDGRQCTFAPRDSEGRPSSSSIPLLCVQYLFNLGLSPKYFGRDVTLLLLWFTTFLVLGGVLLSLIRLRR
jgi:ABC-type multidrug transport system ATPase subunit/ABC-type multidrug transport system permease subunit